MYRTPAIFFTHCNNKLNDSKQKFLSNVLRFDIALFYRQGIVPLLTNTTLMNSPRLASGCLVHSSAARVMLNVIHPSVLA